MKAFFKGIVIIVGLLLIATTLGTFFLGGSLNGMTKRAMEQILTRAFGSKATVEGVSWSPLAQTVELTGVKIENPESFEQGAAMKFDKILVKLDAKTFFTDTPTIPKVTIGGAEMNLRHELGRGINLQALAHDAKVVHDALKPATDSKAAPASTERSAPRIHLEELDVEESRLNVSSSLLPQKQIKLDIKPFSIKSTDDTPLTPGQVAAMFIESLMKQARSADSLLKPLREIIGGDEKAPVEEKKMEAPNETIALEEVAPPK